MLVNSNEMSVINLFLLGCTSRDFFCFLLNPLQLICSPLETQCARLRPCQCWSGGRGISSRILHVTFLFIHPRNVSFFATGWHCGLEFSLSFTITSSSFLQYCSTVIMLHSLSQWLFIYVGQSINLVVVFSSDCAAAPSSLKLETYEAVHYLLLPLYPPSSHGGHWTRSELLVHGKPNQALPSLSAAMISEEARNKEATNSNNK